MSDVFVGRARELTALEDMLERAFEKKGRFALLTGEAGIGKSRLAEELVRRAESKGWLAAWGRSWEGAGTPAYWPWTQLLRRLNTVPQLKALFDATDLSALLDTTAAPSPGDAERARFELFDRVAQLLEKASAVKPLLLVLDDIHSADGATLALLKFVARGLQSSPVLLLATMRDTAFTTDADRSSLLAQVSREAKQIPLERLGREELAEWVSHQPARIEAEKLWLATEGNPLFIEELLAAARKRPDAAWTSTQLPPGIREAIRAHLGLLSEGARRLLETASVLGREVALATLKAIAAPGELEALVEATASGILHELGEGRLRFSHILLRDEVYARLSDERRASLHRSAAAASPASAVAAHHALSAARPEDAAFALERVRAAMRDASSRLAHDDAVRLGRRALEVLGPSLQPSDVCALHVAIGEGLVLAGDIPAGQAVGAQAAAMAVEHGTPELLARAALTHAAEINFSRSSAESKWLRAALAALPQADSALRAHVMARLSTALLGASEHVHEARTLRDDALAMARRVNDEQALFEALNNASGMFPEGLSARERFALYAETVDVAEKRGTIGRIAPILAWHVVSWLELGEPAGAAAAADRVERLLTPYPQPHFRWRVPLVRALLAAVAGRFAEAEQLSRASFAISREHQLVEGQMMYAIYASTVPYISGDDSGLAELLPHFEAIFRNLPMGNIFSALWEAPLGRADRVRESFARLKQLPVEHVIGANQLGWACLRAGTTEYAEFFFQLSLTAPKHNPLTFAPGGFGLTGPYGLLQARLATMTGRRAEALPDFERALKIAHDIKSPPFVAQVQLSWAEALAPDDPSAAAEHARIAVEAASSVGMSVVAAQAEKLLLGKRAAVSKPAAAPPPSASREVTLKREGEWWALEEGGRRVALRDSKGMAYLEALVLAPHRAVHVLELSGIGEESDAGPQLDAKAKQEYRARAEALRSELDEATGFNDSGRIERAQAELDALGAELARALGLGGRDRKAGSAAERARINVQRRLKDVISRIVSNDAELGRHMELSVKTGLFCMYAPTWPSG